MCCPYKITREIVNSKDQKCYYRNTLTEDVRIGYKHNRRYQEDLSKTHRNKNSDTVGLRRKFDHSVKQHSNVRHPTSGQESTFNRQDSLLYLFVTKLNRKFAYFFTVSKGIIKYNVSVKIVV